MTTSYLFPPGEVTGWVMLYFFFIHIKFITTATLQGLLVFLATSSSVGSPGSVPHPKELHKQYIAKTFFKSRHLSVYSFLQLLACEETTRAPAHLTLLRSFQAPVRIFLLAATVIGLNPGSSLYEASLLKLLETLASSSPKWNSMRCILKSKIVGRII